VIDSASIGGPDGGTPITVPCTFVRPPPIQTESVVVVRVEVSETPETWAASAAKASVSPPTTTRSANCVSS
jgi:hypothetical protein